MLNSILGRTKLMEKALDTAWIRDEAISQNIANVDTPGYKRKTVAFEEYLNDALNGSDFKGFKTDERHLSIGVQDVDEIEPKITEDNSAYSLRLDGNNVDIDSEMAQLAKNSIQYNTLVQSLNSSYNRLKSAINEGRK